MQHPLALAAVLGLGLALAACGENTPSDPAEAAIARLSGQGFAIVSDGRGAGQPTALQYEGPPAAVTACGPAGGRAGPTDLAGTASSADGRYAVTQTGQAAAYVIVGPAGETRGIYIVSVERSVATADGVPVARQVEKIEFPPGGAGQFRNGVSCQARS